MQSVYYSENFGYILIKIIITKFILLEFAFMIVASYNFK